MKRLVIIVLMALSLLSAANLKADDRRPVTPYGDFCPRCSRYGYCRFNLSMDEALKALKDYYKRRGLSVRVEKTMGRFLWATVLKGDKVVDRIVLDRRTGRIRSIY